MKVQERKGNKDREILTAMLVSKPVLAAVAARWDSDGLFNSRYANLVAGWAVKYFRKYGKAPGPNIESMYDHWANSNGKDPDLSKTISALLESLSGQYARRRDAVNPDYVIDLAAAHFNLARARKFREELDAVVEEGDAKKVDRLFAEYRKVDIGQGCGFNPFAERNRTADALTRMSEVLFRFGQPALDEFFGDCFERDSFTVFWGGEKVGKSWVLLRTALQAVMCKRRVLYFEVGDMSEHQVLRRLAAFVAKRPYKADKRVRYPVAVDTDGDVPRFVHKDQSYQNPMTAAEADAALVRFAGEYGSDNFRLSCHPNTSITIAGVEAAVDEWARKDWVPDVVVIDYMDLLAPMDGRAETRDQIDLTWRMARGLSQKYHVALVSASQADSGAYEVRVLTRKNFSNAKTKLAHPTGTFGINQDASEKEDQVYRLNPIAVREGEFSEKTCVYVANCLAVADPFVLSSW